MIGSSRTGTTRLCLVFFPPPRGEHRFQFTRGWTERQILWSLKACQFHSYRLEFGYSSSGLLWYGGRHQTCGHVMCCCFSLSLCWLVLGIRFLFCLSEYKFSIDCFFSHTNLYYQVSGPFALLDAIVRWVVHLSIKILNNDCFIIFEKYLRG